ncbi:MAG: AMP-binding protein [Actinobacteria bacterium]|nr:AMP-binding protein [Actinomycetota bacterium]
MPATGSLSDHIEYNAENFPNAPVIAIETAGVWSPVTALDFRSQVRSVAKGLIALGINPGDRVAIFSRTRAEWTIADYAIWYAGAVTVPIYETSSAEQVQWIMQDAHVIATFFEAERTTYPYKEIASSVPHMQHVFIFSDDSLNSLASRGASVSDQDLDARRGNVTPESTATIIYTSGTTGQPKGCVLTHGNLMGHVDNLIAGIPEVFAKPEASTLMFLPLAHVFGRLIQVAMMRARVTMGYCPNPGALVRELESFKPTFLLAVPRVFEKVFNGARTKAYSASKVKGKIFDRAAVVAIKYSESLDTGKTSPALKLAHGLYDRLVYSKLRNAMGGRVTHAISGGASLGARLGHFYRGLGLMVLEGYGLTETTAGSTLNIPGAIKIGSVGRPIFATAVSIASDGEVLLKGAHIFKGYWNNPTATQEVMTENGWFHTGDVGRLDDDGFLYITGRKKELLVTSAGKNVAPTVLEDRLRANPIISQCVVVGDGRPFIAALVTLDQEALPLILQTHGIAEAPISELAHNAAILELVQKAVNSANEAVSNSEAIKKFVILPMDLTIDNGYLTPKLSIKRHVINTDFAQTIDSIYNR